MHTQKPRRRRWLFGLLTMVLTLGIIELLLLLSCVVSPRVDWALHPWRTYYVEDSRLGKRGNPTLPEHDAWGFRNRAIPSRADIVAIGDSQTYGTSVAPAEAWPAVLEEKTGQKVYNLSFAGWGPIQYRTVLDDALKLEPRCIVIGVYFGNDFWDAYQFCYQDDLAPDLQDPRQLEPLQEVEKSSNLRETFRNLSDNTASYRVPRFWRVMGRVWSERIQLLALCRALRLQWVARQKRDWKVQKRLAEASPEDLSVFESDDARTIFTSAYRGQAIDVTDARIEEGLQVTMRALREIGKRCEKVNCELLVVFIPVKEFVFKPFVRDASEHAEIEALWNHHALIELRLNESLKASGISVIDVTAALRNDVSKEHRNPYFPDPDGHPSPNGHAAIAAAIAGHMRGNH